MKPLRHPILAIIALFLICWQSLGFAQKNQYYSELLCRQSAYYCKTVQRGETWRSLFPDARQRDMVQRLNRRNMELVPGLKLAVPRYAGRTNFWSVNPLPTNIRPQGEKVVIVDLRRLAWGAYLPNGQIVNWGPISGGRSYCSDINQPCYTKTGSFRITHSRGAHCKSTLYPVGKGGAPMPYCMFYKGGFALHGSPFLPGFNDSHGCVRMFPRDARWLHNQFVNLPGSGKRPTRVIVQG